MYGSIPVLVRVQPRSGIRMDGCISADATTSNTQHSDGSHTQQVWHTQHGCGRYFGYDLCPTPAVRYIQGAVNLSWTHQLQHAGERLINIPELTAETHCSVARMDDSGAAVPGPAWVNVQSQHGLDWVLPVSNTSSILVVGGVTQLVQVLCAVCVLWICGQRWLESRMLKRELKHE